MIAMQSELTCFFVFFTYSVLNSSIFTER